MRKHHIIFAMAFLAALMIFTSCRKDISLPDPSLSKLFGNWEWVQTSGGLAGQTTTPATAGYTQSIEFNSNGIYKIFRNGDQQDKLTFRLTEGTSIFQTGTAILITYKNTGVSNTAEDLIKQSVQFSGQDTLLLNEECYDCYNYIYVRK